VSARTRDRLEWEAHVLTLAATTIEEHPDIDAASYLRAWARTLAQMAVEEEDRP
jgi:hypothetical protein